MRTKELLNVVEQTLSGCRINDSEQRNLLFKDGHVYSWSSALSVSARLPGDAALEGVISGTDLYTFLARLGKEDVHITCDKKRWHFTADTMEAEIAVKEDAQLERNVVRHNEEELHWKTLPTNFYDCLSICNIPNNMYAKAGVFLSNDMMISTDNKRVNRAKMNGTIDTPVLMAVYSVSEILRLELRFSEYAVTDKWIHFRTLQEGTELLTFSCNRLGDDSVYPADKFSALIDRALESSLVSGQFPSLTNIVTRAQCFDDTVQDKSSVYGNVITLKFERNKLTVMSERGENGSVGRYKEAVGYPNNTSLDISSPVMVKLSAPFLLSALKHTRDFRLSALGNKFLLILTGEFFTTVIQVIGG